MARFQHDTAWHHNNWRSAAPFAASRAATLIFTGSNAGSNRILGGGSRGACSGTRTAQACALARPMGRNSGLLLLPALAARGRAQPADGDAGASAGGQKEDSARSLPVAGLATGGVLPHAPLHPG